MPDPFLFNPEKIILTVIIAFLPAIIYAVVIRYSEKYEREPWGNIGQAFLWGGTLSIVLVILIRGFFYGYMDLNHPKTASDIPKMTFLVVVIITPIISELIKPIGLFFVRGDILEAEDGLIYGAVIGLGYTATENLMYGIFLAPLYGIQTFVTIIFMRSMSVMFIQSSTTALTCYGITRAMKVKHKTGRYLSFPLFLSAAILIAATFNYIVFMDVFNVGDILFSISSSLMFSIIFAFLLMFMIYFKIYRLDRIDEKEEKGAGDQKEATQAGQKPQARQQRARPQRTEPMYPYDTPPRGQPPPYAHTRSNRPPERIRTPREQQSYPPRTRTRPPAQARRQMGTRPPMSQMPRQRAGYQDQEYPPYDSGQPRTQVQEQRRAPTRPPQTRATDPVGTTRKPKSGTVTQARYSTIEQPTNEVSRAKRPPKIVDTGSRAKSKTKQKPKTIDIEEKDEGEVEIDWES